MRIITPQAVLDLIAGREPEQVERISQDGEGAPWSY